MRTALLVGSFALWTAAAWSAGTVTVYKDPG